MDYQIGAMKQDIEWHGQYRDVLRKQIFTLEKQVVEDWEKEPTNGVSNIEVFK